MQIAGFQKTSLLDFPDKISAIIFTPGCNFKCGYCHNPELFGKKEPVIEIPVLLDFLNTRKNKLDGIVITGGEPCLQEGLIDFIKTIKQMGFLVKLDTNGYYPEVLEEAIKFIDYAAMDIKAPLDKYSKITNTDCDVKRIKKSIDLLINSKINYEFRTTVVRSQLDFCDFQKIGMLISGAERYYLQRFIPSKTLDEKFRFLQTYTDDEFEIILRMLTCNIKQVIVR